MYKPPNDRNSLDYWIGFVFYFGFFLALLLGGGLVVYMIIKIAELFMR